MNILQYADDNLLVRNGGWKHVWSLKSVLQEFELVLDLDINYFKSNLIGFNLNMNFMRTASNFLSCRI